MDNLIKHKPSTTISTGIQAPISILDKQGIILNESDKIKRDYEKSYELLQTKYNERKNVPTPNIILPGSQIMVTATPPYIQKQTVSGIILDNEYEGSQLEIDRLKNSTDNVSDFQKVLIVGIGAKNYFEDKLNEGDFVKISFARYRSLQDGSMDGRVSSNYRIPTTMMDGQMYMILDYLDILYIQKPEHVDPKFK